MDVRLPLNPSGRTTSPSVDENMRHLENIHATKSLRDRLHVYERIDEEALVFGILSVGEMSMAIDSRQKRELSHARSGEEVSFEMTPRQFWDCPG